ncbi:hypothetical protein [Sphingomonas leidyi]|uniref:hypothetical protein n=1 Tax=Sphingomonas leidyi TaxID=68569 RepID=UPI0036D33A4F
MKVLLALALAASLSACALGAHPTTAASVAVAADRAAHAETAYADAAEFATITAPALKPADATSAAALDRKAFTALSVARLTYPADSAMVAADRARLADAIARSNTAHDALQSALAQPG